MAEGTWVATGMNMGGDGNQRQCVQIVSGCKHEGSRACHEVYLESPSQVVLPSSAGTEYIVGLPPSEVSPKQAPKIAANCITNGETVASGNMREDVGICDDGKWVEKSKYDAAQLAVFEHNQTHLVETSFGKASSGSLNNTTQGSPVASDGFTRREQINQEKTYNSINDKIWTGISISLGGKELTIGSKINSNGWILPAASNSELNHDNLYSGINISWLGGDLVFGKQNKDSKVYFDVDRPTFPSNYNEGFQGGAISCGLNPLLMAGCGVVMGVAGGINNLFTPDKPQSLGTPTHNTSTQINDTGPSQINNVTTPRTAGNTGGFNLIADINDSPVVDETNKTAKMSYFNQKQYSTVANADGSTWDESGCGIMTGAMVMSMIDPSAKPEDYNALLEQHGGVSVGGTGWFDQHKPILEEQGFNIVPVAGSPTHIANQINEYSKYGIPVWINSNIDKPDGSKGFGHQTLAVGTCPDGSCIILNDPYYGENYEMPIERFDVDCSNTCDGGRTTWVVNAIIPPAEAL